MAETDFKNFVYVSATKLEQYSAQMAQVPRVSTEIKLKTPLVEHTTKSELDPNASNKYTQLQRVVAEVERRGLLGDLLDYKPWFRDRITAQALLVRDKVFYVGQRRISGSLPIHYAFQCSLANHIASDYEKRRLEEANSCGIEQKFDMGRIRVILPSVTSSNWMFASALSTASTSVDESEQRLLDEPGSDVEYIPRFFRSQEDFELHQKYKPSLRDLDVDQIDPWVNADLRRAMSGLFGRFREGLLEPPPPSISQTLANLFGIGAAKRAARSQFFESKLEVAKKLHNFEVVSRRVKSASESRVLEDILQLSSPSEDVSLEIVGIRLLDAYRPRGRSEDGRVILGSPLYLA